MKLLFCPYCHDMFKLLKNVVRTCTCGKCKGKYNDNINAVYNDGIPIGIDNAVLGMACANQPVAGMGRNFPAFVIAKNVDTLIKTDNIE